MQAFPVLREHKGALGQEHGRDYGVPGQGYMQKKVNKSSSVTQASLFVRNVGWTCRSVRRGILPSPGLAFRWRMWGWQPLPEPAQSVLLFLWLLFFALRVFHACQAQRRRVFLWAIRTGDKLFEACLLRWVSQPKILSTVHYRMSLPDVHTMVTVTFAGV